MLDFNEVDPTSIQKCRKESKTEKKREEKISVLWTEMLIELFFWLLNPEQKKKVFIHTSTMYHINREQKLEEKRRKNSGDRTSDIDCNM